jgi:Lar family restriction alleviation protein
MITAHGYYWIVLADEPAEVVEIDGDSMYRCGSDVTCKFVNGEWIEFGEPMDVVSGIGPITPPGPIIARGVEMLDKEQMKPCPFCGSADIHTGRVTFGHGDGGESVKCGHCGAEVPDDYSGKRAAEKWNARPADEETK